MKFNKFLPLLIVLIGIIFKIMLFKSLGLLLLFCLLITLHIPNKYISFLKEPVYLIQAYILILSGIVYIIDKESLTFSVLNIGLVIFMLFIAFFLVVMLKSKKGEEKRKYAKLLRQTYINFNFCLAFTLLNHWI